MNNLQFMIENFADRWGPKGGSKYHLFLFELQDLLEAYGAAALQHQSFPDAGHEHGEPV